MSDAGALPAPIPLAREATNGNAPGRSPSSDVMALAPLLAAVFVGFLVIGAALPVLPLHVHDHLGFGLVMVGIVTGFQFAASLVARVWSGRAADLQGPKWAVVAGLAAAALAGLLYLASLAFPGSPRVSVAILIAGRAVLGGAESFIITGATTWGFVRVGAANAGKVIGWMGTAMFAALAVGAPLGAVLYASGGFGAVSLAATAAPLATLILIAPLRPAQPAHKRGPGVLWVAKRIWLPGVGAALASIGYGVIAAFGSLLFTAHGWTPVWLAFSAYAAALIVARIAFGHLPDRLGGASVALAFVLIESAGLAMMGLATGVTTATLGAALSGFGYALVFPALGVEAVRRAPAESRGAAMGAYSACLDVALGVSGPLIGAIAGRTNLGAAFLVAAATAIGAATVALRLLCQPASRTE